MDGKVTIPALQQMKKDGRKIVGVQIPIGHQAAFSGVLDLLNMKVYKGKDRGTEIEEVPTGYTEEAAERREKIMDAAAEGDDALAMKYLEGETLTEDEIDQRIDRMINSPNDLAAAKGIELRERRLEKRNQREVAAGTNIYDELRVLAENYKIQQRAVPVAYSQRDNSLEQLRIPNPPGQGTSAGNAEASSSSSIPVSC